MFLRLDLSTQHFVLALLSQSGRFPGCTTLERMTQPPESPYRYQKFFLISPRMYERVERSPAQEQ
jgi:hypothetical protein